MNSELVRKLIEGMLEDKKKENRTQVLINQIKKSENVELILDTIKTNPILHNGIQMYVFEEDEKEVLLDKLKQMCIIGVEIADMIMNKYGDVLKELD